jgi:hypothetical protein
MPIEGLASHRHLDLIERVLHDEVRIKLVDLLHHRVHIARHGIREQEELRARQGLKTRQAKLVCLEVIQA